MGGARSMRLGLAVVPALLLAQCAPQCAPSAPPPPVVTYTPVGGSFWRLVDLTPSGRFGLADGGGQLVRVDLETGMTAATGAATSAMTGGRDLLTADGASVITMVGGNVVRRDVATGSETPYALPAGWVLTSLTSVSTDGTRIGVMASNIGARTSAALVLDETTGAWDRPDERLGAGRTGGGASGAHLDASGTTAVFEVHDERPTCQACTNIWAVGPSGPTLVSATPGGGRTQTGRNQLHDVSGNGRFVLFESSATDIAGRQGTAVDQLYVRDLVSGSTTSLPHGGGGNLAVRSSISDDGQRIALVSVQTDQTGGYRVASLYDRTSATLVPLVRSTFAQAGANGDVLISADGRRIAFAATGDDMNVVRVDITG
jgi:hypothetical protein